MPPPWRPASSAACCPVRERIEHHGPFGSMIFSGVTAQEEAVGVDDVGQGQRQRVIRDQGAGHDAAPGVAGQQRADGQAQLIHQVGRDELAEQVRTALGEQPLMTAFGQRTERGLQTDGFLSGHDHVGVPGQFGPQIRG